MATPQSQTDALVIGAGVVGLASAAALARSGLEVIVVEAEADIGRGQTSRNSEVVHAGLYYTPGSLKARACVQGRRMLEERCARLGLPYQRIGKWIVATAPDETPRIDKIFETGTACGVEGLTRYDDGLPGGVLPGLNVVAAVHSAATGIVDAMAFSRSLQAELEELGGFVAVGRRVTALDWTGSAHRVEVVELDEHGEAAASETIDAQIVVNAAGIDSGRIGELAGLDIDALEDRIHLFKGDYFTLKPGVPSPFDTLVYPVPAGAGLGVHVTLDLAGAVRFGPDAEAVDAPRYDVDPAKAAKFTDAIRRYWPGLPDDALVPAYAGLRAKRSADPKRFMDFVVREESDRGRPGLIQCIGIESPGLTSSLALAEEVAALAR